MKGLEVGVPRRSDERLPRCGCESGPPVPKRWSRKLRVESVDTGYRSRGVGGRLRDVTLG